MLGLPGSRPPIAEPLMVVLAIFVFGGCAGLIATRPRQPLTAHRIVTVGMNAMKWVQPQESSQASSTGSRIDRGREPAHTTGDR